MKFLCDKCKTRYSIGEDRVRGKILKIRCKNCANVITVREGMDAGPSDPNDSRRHPTTAVPKIDESMLDAPSGAAASAPPPPALDPEWYVSLDGVQTGPLTLQNAQKWVASKPLEADLHCWSEGFDDWLPVDKVSHFRNLRKPRPVPPARPAAPPVPARTSAPGTSPARASRPKTVPPPVPTREEQTPLFASTMAAIEKDARTSTPGVPAKLNGAASSGSMPSIAQTAKGTGSEPARRSQTPSGRFDALKGPGHAALADAFDNDEASDAHTQLDAKPFEAPAPVSAPAAQKTVQQALDDEDDSLSIGEVSRVVNLKDIAPRPRSRPITPGNLSTTPGNGTGPTARVGGSTGSSSRIGGATASSPRIGTTTGTAARISATPSPFARSTASVPKLSPEQLGMNVDPSLAPHAPDESIVAQTFAQRHRRGMLALVAAAVLLVAGVVGVLAYVTSKQTEEIGGGLGGGTKTIDTSRPEDIVRRQLPPTPETPKVETPTRPKWTGTRPVTTNPVQPADDDPKGMSLKASEIEDMAAKQGEGTKRCYMRAQKGALGFEISDVKKIAVTLTVGKDGIVNDVQLSSHGNDSFGQCLIARIKAWRFRESPSGGTFRISLAFSSS